MITNARIPALPSLSSLIRKSVPQGGRRKPPRIVRFPTFPTIVRRRWERRVRPAVNGLPATEPEVTVAEWLARFGIPFEFQVLLLGLSRKVRGSTVVDFLLATQPPIVIRVQGVYWHGRTAVKQLADLEQREALEEAGYVVVDVWEDDLERDPEGVMRAAVAGIELYGP